MSLPYFEVLSLPWEYNFIIGPVVVPSRADDECHVGCHIPLDASGPKGADPDLVETIKNEYGYNNELCQINRLLFLCC